MSRHALALALALPAAAAAQQPQQHSMHSPPPPQIVVSADGEVKVSPDRATLYVAVETRAANAAQAGNDNARRTRAVMDALRKLGIPPERLATEGYAVHPDWRYSENEQKLVGYVARNTIRVELEQIDRTGSAIDASLAAGANNIHAMNFWSSRQDEARRNALAAAVAKAKADAEALARAAGGSLGTLLEINTVQHAVPYPAMARMEMAQDKAASTPINPGEQSIMATIHARWQFVPGSR